MSLFGSIKVLYVLWVRGESGATKTENSTKKTKQHLPMALRSE